MKLLILIALCAVPALGNKLPTIVGGRDVNPPGKWPWQASLQFRSSNSHTCGGSLISTNWVLCAAHCVGSGASRLQIVFGMHDRTTQRQGSPKKYMISSITRHPQYSQSGSQGFPNDIAVIRLSTAATLNNFVAPITLAASTAGDFVGSDCWITGWGSSTEMDLCQTSCRRPTLMSSLSPSARVSGEAASRDIMFVSETRLTQEREHAMVILVVLSCARLVPPGPLLE